MKIVPFTLTCAALAFAASVATPRERTLEFEYAVAVKDIPDKAGVVDLWVPVPHDDPYQRIGALKFDAPAPFKIATDADGNQILHLRMARPAGGTASFAMRFTAARKEHIQSLAEPLPKADTEPSLKAESQTALDRWLKPDRLVPLDDKIRGWAREVVDAAHASTDLEMARAIYKHIVATVKYDKTGKGWGNGDIYYACDARRGNCTDFHAIFIGYARALGIPARFAIGFPLPSDRGAGKIGGYHCWAEFYAKGIGWVPVDASEAAKNLNRREYFFGAHDENRVEFSRGRDLALAPRQKGDALNYFVYPYVEVDGQKYTLLETSFSYKDLVQ
jgi:transglutaminase-like putative cysteine protease